MNNDQIKQMLLQLEDTEIDFTVTMSGKESKRVNGLYKPDTHEIILHNLNFKSDNMLIYTAIHEYTHHLITVEKDSLAKGLGTSSCKCHTNEFWAKFHSLLEVAESKGLYVMGLEQSPELEALTEEIKKNYLEQDGKLMIEFGKKLAQAHELCEKANIRYEDYLDRVLQLPRNTAAQIRKISVTPIDPSIGFENMKLVASAAPAKRAEVQENIKAGKSPDTVRSLMKRKVEEVDQKTKLEKEKHRLEKTIEQLNQRLELIEESLSVL
ncbi:MAG: hypothetical protein K5839_05965 [Treponemataceae bacterium]|nr:hypothetical protein [Treponemataceae bacterium]